MFLKAFKTSITNYLWDENTNKTLYDMSLTKNLSYNAYNLMHVGPLSLKLVKMSDIIVKIQTTQLI